MAGDFIKREDAYAAIENLYPGIPMVKPLIKKWHENNKAYMECEDAIERVPAADVRPVVHARWLRRDDMPWIAECKCSACGYADYPNKSDRYWFERKFCPNCGAMMDEEEADGERLHK